MLEVKIVQGTGGLAGRNLVTFSMGQIHTQTAAGDAYGMSECLKACGASEHARHPSHWPWNGVAYEPYSAAQHIASLEHLWEVAR